MIINIAFYFIFRCLYENDGEAAIVKILLKYGSDKNARDKFGEVPIGNLICHQEETATNLPPVDKMLKNVQIFGRKNVLK